LQAQLPMLITPQDKSIAIRVNRNDMAGPTRNVHCILCWLLVRLSLLVDVASLAQDVTPCVDYVMR
jgi:hypothetical protein